ncbi:dipeptidase [Candidatus Bathyarchaeota archaeon]|nr:dipeptidase [Candidatus Bathyarchaeota archaeon]
MIELSKEQEERAFSLHKEAIVIDALNSSVMDEMYFQMMKEGGITAINYTVAGKHNLSETIKRIVEMQRMIEKNTDKVLLGTSTNDVIAAKKEEKTAIFLGFQNIDPIEGKLALLKVYHKLGIRIIQPTYHYRTIVGDGCAEPADSGLSAFGFKFVEQMNKLGMVIDLAHAGKATSLDAIEASKAPVIFSHSSIKALVDTHQNKTDEEIQAAAEKGGVIGISAFPRLLGDKPDLSIDDLMDHVDYVVKLVGANHVGIGTDFFERQAESPVMRRLLILVDGQIYKHPKDIDSVTKVPNITRELVARGYSDEEIKKILGGNFLRVFKRVFKE